MQILILFLWSHAFDIAFHYICPGQVECGAVKCMRKNNCNVRNLACLWFSHPLRNELIGAETSQNWTALLLAVNSNLPRTVEVLLKYGAGIQILCLPKFNGPCTYVSIIHIFLCIRDRSCNGCACWTWSRSVQFGSRSSSWWGRYGATSEN